MGFMPKCEWTFCQWMTRFRQAAPRIAMDRQELEKRLNAEIGRRLRYARLLTYPSQTAFARALGISDGMLNKIEMGLRSLSLLNLVTAANKLKTGAEYLLSGDLANVEPALRRELIHHHPQLLEQEPWGPDPSAPPPLLVPRRVRGAPDAGRRHKDSVSRSADTALPPDNDTWSSPTIPGAARKTE